MVDINQASWATGVSTSSTFFEILREEKSLRIFDRDGSCGRNHLPIGSDVSGVYLMQCIAHVVAGTGHCAATYGLSHEIEK